MKLTEHQLAQMFQNSKNKAVEQHSSDMFHSKEASDVRLKEAEKIADNSTLSASHQIINQLQEWSTAVGHDLELSLKPKFTATVLNWFKPALATAAMVSAVYFLNPNMTAIIDENSQNGSDLIMTSTSFEANNENSDIIHNVSFDRKVKHDLKSDIILKNNFS